LGNKCDLQNRKVSTEQGKALAAELNMLFLETSAKEGINCSDAFMNLVKEIKRKEAPKKKQEKDKGFFKKLFASCNLI
jgi:GTPase SAR1 family protein